MFKDLPAELPPERSGFHTIPLKENESAPNKKMYRMTRDEMRCKSAKSKSRCCLRKVLFKEVTVRPFL